MGMGKAAPAYIIVCQRSVHALIQRGILSNDWPMVRQAADAMREKEQDAAEEARLAAEQQRLRDKAQEDKARQHVRQSQQVCPS